MKLLEKHRHDDGEIAEAALQAFEWNVWIPKDVQATVSNGRVVLGGTVELNYQRHTAQEAVGKIAGVTDVMSSVERATSAAWSAAGVTKVLNHISIGGR